MPIAARAVSFAAPLLALVALAACSAPKPTEFAPSCPRVAIVADAADLTRYRPGGGQDLTDLVLDARITGFKGNCERDDARNVRTTMTVDLAVLRGPASRGRRTQVAYFVAVRDGETLLDKQIYSLDVSFPENQDQVRITSSEIELVVAVNREKSAAAYDVLIGFQLSPEDLAFNRRRGPR